MSPTIHHCLSAGTDKELTVSQNNLFIKTGRSREIIETSNVRPNSPSKGEASLSLPLQSITKLFAIFNPLKAILFHQDFVFAVLFMKAPFPSLPSSLPKETPIHPLKRSPNITISEKSPVSTHNKMS